MADVIVGVGGNRGPNSAPSGPFRMKPPFPLKVLLPLALGVIVSVAVLVFSEFGYRRLEVANRQSTGALEMQALLNDVMALVADAETGQRGYLLTGDPSYLQPYKNAVEKLEPTLVQLRESVNRDGPTAARDRLTRINNLVGKKINELESTLALNDKSGREAAFQLIDTGIGKRTMDELRSEAGAMATELRASLVTGTTRWKQDIEFARIGMVTMTAFTVALLLVVWALARREIALREEQQRRSIQEQARLESVVSERTAELSELSNYLQSVREEEKSHLARDIHDELGGILVGAKMDVAWAIERTKANDPTVTSKLERAVKMLDEGVEIKRRVIEELRPTLLDNLGLAAAIDWQVRQTCERAGLNCKLNLGDVDLDLPPEVSIGLYRVVQEGLTNIVKYAKAKNVSVEMLRTENGISLVVEDDGIGLPSGAETNALSHGISGMRQRVRALRGEFRIHGQAGGGTIIEAHVPLPAPSPPQTKMAGTANAPA
jgi:signal transduction histidine kinase